MKCSELEKDDIVLFSYIDTHTKEKMIHDGIVIQVIKKRRYVSIGWMEGAINRIDNVPFSYLIAKFDEEKGEEMKFFPYSGPSILLEPN